MIVLTLIFRILPPLVPLSRYWPFFSLLVHSLGFPLHPGHFLGLAIIGFFQEV